MGATNRLTSLDPALTRPGRFDRVLELSLPDEAGRLSILRVHAARTALSEPDEVLPRVAALTGGFCGAELAALVNEASIRAVRTRDSAIRATHYEAALADMAAARASKRRPARTISPEADIDASLGAYAAMIRSTLAAAANAPMSTTASGIEDNE
jgi:ATP-dependent Zn protease